jgi:serpin B
MPLKKSVWLVSGLVLLQSVLNGSTQAADDTNVAATAVNALGVDLLTRVAKPDENALLSPYSIQSALAMTYAGAAGETKTEMARVLHYPADETNLHRSFAAFRENFDAINKSAIQQQIDSDDDSLPGERFMLEVANRLYGQNGYAFRPEFLALVKDKYSAPFQPVDFVHASESVRSEINRWVSLRTHERINRLIPPGGVNANTQLTLVNAIYFKASWAEEFRKSETKLEPFLINGTASVDVWTMNKQSCYNYMRGDGFCAVVIPYYGRGQNILQLLILLPDTDNGVATLQAKLTPELFAKCARAESSDLILHLPKFKIEPPMIPLGTVLQSLGIKRAFDLPHGSADFSRMAPCKADDYLLVSEVFHKVFIDVNEKGTEAAGATAVLQPPGCAEPSVAPPKPIEIRVDHPFLFAIQHRASGACLFLGRVVDPR